MSKNKNNKHLYKSFTSKPYKITDHKDNTLNTIDTARVLTLLKDEIRIITDIVEWSLENDKQLLVDYDQYDGYSQASKIGIALGVTLPENIFPFQINNLNNYQEGVITQEEYYKNKRKTSGNSRRDWLYHRRLFDEVSSWLERIKASNKVNSNDKNSDKSNDNIDNSDNDKSNDNGLSDSDKYISAGWCRTVNTTMPSNLTPKISLSITDAQYATYVNKKTCFADGYLKLKMVINGSWYHLYFTIDTNRFKEAVKFSLPDITITPNDTIKFNFCAVYDKIYKHISTEYFIGIDVNISNYVVASVINKDGVIVHSTTLSRRVNSLSNSIKATSKQVTGLHKKLKRLTTGTDEYVKTYNEIRAQRSKNTRKKIELSIIAAQEIAYLSYMWDNAAVIFEDLSWISNTMVNGRWNRGELVKRTEEYVGLNGGIVLKVNAAQTSTKCHHCDEKLTFKSWKIAYCSTCEITHDRDINASVNIAKRGVKTVIKSSKTRSKAASFKRDKNSTVLRTPVTIDSLRYNKRVSTRVKSVPTGKCDNKKRGYQFRVARERFREEVVSVNNNGTVTYNDDMTVLMDDKQSKCLLQDPDKATSFYNNSNVVHYLLI